MTMPELMLAAAAAGVLTLIGLLHLYWAAGGRVAFLAVLPEVDDIDGASGRRSRRKAFEPGPGATLAVALALLAMASVVAMRAGWLPALLPRGWVDGLLLAIAAMMLLRAIGDFRLVGFTKRLRDSAFARMDTWLYSPLCVALGIALAVLSTSA